MTNSKTRTWEDETEHGTGLKDICNSPGQTECERPGLKLGSERRVVNWGWNVSQGASSQERKQGHSKSCKQRFTRPAISHLVGGQ